MYVLQNSARHGKLTFTMLALAAGISVWAVLGSVSGVPGAIAASAPECVDQADVLAAQDRSRNGVSLTCNQAMLSEAAVR